MSIVELVHPADDAESFKYDLFISYATDPDYALVRRLEGFLESFHGLKTPKSMPLRELAVCIDGSDFSLARLRARQGNDADAISLLIADYIDVARLLVRAFLGQCLLDVLLDLGRRQIGAFAHPAGRLWIGLLRAERADARWSDQQTGRGESHHQSFHQSLLPTLSAMPA